MTDRISYPIDSHGNHIEINPHNGEYRLMCWSVDEHDQYRSLIVYEMNRELLKGLADFINKYLVDSYINKCLENN